MKKADKSFIHLNLLLPSGVEMIVGEHITNTFRRHVHSSYVLGIVDSGKRLITRFYEPVEIAENEMFVINPETVHSCSSDKECGHSYKVLILPKPSVSAMISGILPKKDTLPVFNQIRYQDRRLSQNLTELFAILEKSNSLQYKEQSIFSFLSFFISYDMPSRFIETQNNDRRRRIEKVCGFIHRRYKEKITLEQLSGVACLSPFHFQRVFKEEVGITPHEYLCDYRIKQAEKLLLKTDNTADIALRAGFFDQSHFIKTFRKTVGVTPGAFRWYNGFH